MYDRETQVFKQYVVFPMRFPELSQEPVRTLLLWGPGNKHGFVAHGQSILECLFHRVHVHHVNSRSERVPITVTGEVHMLVHSRQQGPAPSTVMAARGTFPNGTLCVVLSHDYCDGADVSIRVDVPDYGHRMALTLPLCQELGLPDRTARYLARYMLPLMKDTMSPFHGRRLFETGRPAPRLAYDEQACLAATRRVLEKLQRIRPPHHKLRSTVRHLLARENV